MGTSRLLALFLGLAVWVGCNGSDQQPGDAGSADASTDGVGMVQIEGGPADGPSSSDSSAPDADALPPADSSTSDGSDSGDDAGDSGTGTLPEWSPGVLGCGVLNAGTGGDLTTSTIDTGVHWISATASGVDAWIENDAVYGFDGSRWILWRPSQRRILLAQPNDNATYALLKAGVLLRWTAGHFSLYDAQGSGALLADVSDPLVTASSQMDVAPDGSSVMAWSSTGTSAAVWQRNGTFLFNHTFSGPVQGVGKQVVLLADRVLAVTTSNSNTRLETVLLPSGMSSLSNALEGTFDRWFLDGSHFSMVFGGATRIYDPSATLVDSTSSAFSVGWGDKIVQVTQDSYHNVGVQAYRLGSLGTPVFQKTYSGADTDPNSATSPRVAAAAAIIITGVTGVNGPYTLVRFDRPDVVEDTYDLFGSPAVGSLPYFDRGGHWVVQLGHGALYDSYNASSLANPYALSCGQTVLRGGSTGQAALLTETGTILLDTTGGKLTVLGTIRKLAANAEFVQDGSKLALVSTGPSLQATSAPPASEQALRTYDAKTGSLLNTLDGVTDVGVSADGSKLFVRKAGSNQETDLSGTAIFTDQGQSTALRLSPSGKGVAAVDGPTPPQTPPATRIYLSGAYQGSIAASVAGWISEAQVIGNTYMFQPRVGIVWTGGAVFDLSGNVVKSVSLPPAVGGFNYTDQIYGLRLLANGHVFFRSHNQIRDVVADTAVWTDGTGTANPGDLVGGYDVYLANQHTVTFATPTP